MVTKPKRPCKHLTCTNITDKGYCDEHSEFESQKQYDKYSRNKKSKTFYNSREWLKVRKLVLIRDKYLCQHCFKLKKIKRAEMIDHIIPITINWKLRLTINNLQALCNSCHGAKTAKDMVNYKG